MVKIIKFSALILVLLLASAAIAQTGIRFDGFGQFVYTETEGLQVPMARMRFQSEPSIGLDSILICYNFYTDVSPREGFEIGDANIEIKSWRWYVPDLKVGWTLCPVKSQLPPPDKLPLWDYPQASFRYYPYEAGVFLLKKIGGLKYNLGIVNGNGKPVDDNKSKDFTGRCTYTFNLPLESTLKIGTVYRRGKQIDGKRSIYGCDITWASDSLDTKQIPLDRFEIKAGNNKMTYNTTSLGRWLWLKVGYKYFEFVAMIEGFKDDIKTADTWKKGHNLSLIFLPSKKTGVGLFQYKSPIDKKNIGFMVQQYF